ncbi:MAG: glycosyltransferase family 39 protein [Planctomycetaceae bacterium]
MTPDSQNPIWKRQLALAISIGMAFIAMILATAGSEILTRPLWMDEVHTWLIVTDPSLSHAMTALSHGADFNPPTYYLAVRVFTVLFGSSFTAIRLFSLLAMAGSLGLIAAMLGRRFGFVASAAATSAIAMQPLIIQQATEGRFYSFWFLLVVAFVFVRSSNGSELKRTVVSSLFAVLICTVHYFGVLSLGLIFLVDWRNQDREAGRLNWLRFASPYLAGAVSVVGCMGFYFGQRSSLSVATWISSPTLARTYEFFLAFFPILPLALAGIGWLLFRSEATDEGNESHRYCLSLSCFGMPVVLLGFTLVLQPVLVERYAIVCFVAWPVVIATMLKKVKPMFGIAFIAVCILLGADTSRDLLVRYRQIDTEAKRIASRLESVSEPVIFEDRIEHYPAVLGRPERSWFLLDFEGSAKEKVKLRTVQRDVGRAVSRFYPQFDVRSMDRLVSEGQQSFVVVPYRVDLVDHESAADERRLREEYPEFNIKRIARRVFRFQYRGLPAAAK